MIYNARPRGMPAGGRYVAPRAEPDVTLEAQTPEAAPEQFDETEPFLATIAVDPYGSDDVVIVRDATGSWRIHREDADPEHRFTAHRLAAAWFGNIPQTTL